MSQQYPSFPSPTSQLMPPAPPKKAWWKKPVVIMPAAALLLGLGIGSASAKTETVEVEKRVEVPGPERVVTKEVKVNVPSTPASCLEALDLNEQAFSYASESLGYVLKGQYANANAITEKMKALTPRANAAKAECRAS